MFDKKLKNKLKKSIFDILFEILEEKDFRDLNYLVSISILLKHKKIELKNYIRLIKKSTKFLEKNFDEVYLLYYSLEHGRKVYHYNQNKLILDSLYHISEILNNNDYIRESDKINNVLSKIELGFQRYFIHDSIYVEKFSESEDMLELKNNNIDFENKLNDKRYKKYLEHFPEKLYDKKTKSLFDIKKSLFSKENLNIKSFEKDQIILENLNSVYVMVQILDLLESGK